MGKFHYNESGYPVWNDSGKLVHRTVAARKVGGRIGEGREVHHKDGNTKNFRKSNLTIMSRDDHRELHRKKRLLW